jgi:hypothetical protein
MNTSNAAVLMSLRVYCRIQVNVHVWEGGLPLCQLPLSTRFEWTGVAHPSTSGVTHPTYVSDVQSDPLMKLFRVSAWLSGAKIC